MSPPEKDQEFKPIPNPYITGNPLRGTEVFFGHEDDFAYMRQRLIAEKDGIVMLFAGARRSGKTSIMFQILEGRLGEEFLPIFVDMHRMAGVVGDREFFGQMAALVLEGVKDERLVAEYYDFSEGNPVITFDRLLGDIQQVFPGRRLLFLVDEAEKLKTMVDSKELTGAVLTYMASVLESRQISFCFNGSRGLVESQGADWRRLMGKGDYREISFLSREDTLRLIQQPVEGKVDYADGVVDAIYALTFGQPFYTQIICTYVVDYLTSAQRNRLEMEDLEEVVRTIVDNPPPQLIFEWDGFNQAEKLALSLLSEESSGPWTGITSDALVESIRENNYPLSLSAENLHITLEGLYERKLLERDEEGAYYILMDLFRQWIRRARSIWRLVEEQEPKTKKPLWAGLAAIGALAVVVVAVLWMSRTAEIDEIRRQQAAAVRSTTGKVYIESNLSDVEVLVDGQLVRSAPGTIDSLEPGTYVIEVRNERYNTYREEVEVKVGDTRILKALMKRLTGMLVVSSQPGGAQVTVRGEKDTSGTTPLTSLELPTGNYAVTVRKQGYVEARRTVAIADGQETPLEIDLIARVGGVYLVSEPPGAGIVLDGRRLEGNTPYSGENLGVGQHRLVLELAAHHRLDTTFDIGLGRTDTISYKLALLPATLDLVSDPLGADIFVDDRAISVGKTPQVLSLEAGKHRVRIEREGYDAHEFEQEYQPGKTYKPPVKKMNPQYGRVRIVRPLFGIVVVEGPDGVEEREVPPAIELRVGTYRLVEKGKADSIEVYVYKDSTIAVSLP